MTDQTAYFRKRLAEEQARANAAQHTAVRRAHLGLAALYAQELRAVDEPLLQAVA